MGGAGLGVRVYGIWEVWGVGVFRVWGVWVLGFNGFGVFRVCVFADSVFRVQGIWEVRSFVISGSGDLGFKVQVIWGSADLV